MTREEIERFLNGDGFAWYDGEVYYFDCINGNGTLIMRDINNDYAHCVPCWKKRLREFLYSFREVR